MSTQTVLGSRESVAAGERPHLVIGYYREPATDRQRRRDRRHCRGGARVVRAAAPDDARRSGQLRAGGRTEHEARPAHRRPRVPIAPRRLPGRRRDRLFGSRPTSREPAGSSSTGSSEAGGHRLPNPRRQPRPARLLAPHTVADSRPDARHTSARRNRVRSRAPATRAHHHLRNDRVSMFGGPGPPRPAPPARRDKAVTARKTQVNALEPFNEASVNPEPRRASPSGRDCALPADGDTLAQPRDWLEQQERVVCVERTLRRERSFLLDERVPSTKANTPTPDDRRS